MRVGGAGRCGRTPPTPPPPRRRRLRAVAAPVPLRPAARERHLCPAYRRPAAGRGGSYACVAAGSRAAGAARVGAAAPRCAGLRHPPPARHSGGVLERRAGHTYAAP
ncbi:hypothetical protein C3489_34035 [Streptomyces sp. Ru71]|nr:hypothetical protein C3489_34035 [Streptomyces sp. Ru71]